jgi:hypothetical protein
MSGRSGKLNGFGLNSPMIANSIAGFIFRIQNIYHTVDAQLDYNQDTHTFAISNCVAGISVHVYLCMMLVSSLLPCLKCIPCCNSCGGDKSVVKDFLMTVRCDCRKIIFRCACGY